MQYAVRLLHPPNFGQMPSYKFIAFLLLPFAFFCIYNLVCNFCLKLNGVFSYMYFILFQRDHITMHRAHAVSQFVTFDNRHECHSTTRVVSGIAPYTFIAVMLHLVWLYRYILYAVCRYTIHTYECTNLTPSRKWKPRKKTVACMKQITSMQKQQQFVKTCELNGMV